MIYGKRRRPIRPRAAYAALLARRAALAARPDGPERHADLVALLIDWGGLWQAVADAEFTGVDRQTPAQAELAAAGLALAAAVARSLDAGMTGAPPPAAALALSAGLPACAEQRDCEGYRHYALYPEAVLEAARRHALDHRVDDGPPVAIGIRSIGASLAAIVAAAIGAPPPLTVRPVGPPFGRVVRLGADLAAAARAAGAVVIVDEGPGLSGSSFGAVADALEAAGVKRERIAFVSGHDSLLGPEASAAHQTRWRAARRYAPDPDEPLRLLRLVLGQRALAADLSGGAWRGALYGSEAEWPATHPHWERRKALVDTPRGRALYKFAGLGHAGAEAKALAERLAAHGLAPPPEGFAHGFLATRWIEGARLLRASDGPPQAAAIGRYIGARARLLPRPEPWRGASLPALVAMGEAVGGAHPGWLKLKAQARTLAARARPVAIDNALAPHEWLSLPDGRLMKTDGLDHHNAHDLIGCQDPAWDVAAAISAFDLDEAAQAQLVAAASEAWGRAIDAELLAFFRPCELAYQLGRRRLAVAALETSWRGEAARNARTARDLAGRLAALLAEPPLG